MRMSCPSCAGRLRPLDPMKATRSAKKMNLPALDPPPGVTKCCQQSVITTTPADRGPHYQEVPYGTTAWTLSYGRRALVENTNSVLRTGLARLSTGYFRVFGKDKVALLVGLALAALNLKMAEKSRHHDEVEVVEFDLEDDHTVAADDVAGESTDGKVEADPPPPEGPAPPGA